MVLISRGFISGGLYLGLIPVEYIWRLIFSGLSPEELYPGCL